MMLQKSLDGYVLSIMPSAAEPTDWSADGFHGQVEYGS